MDITDMETKDDCETLPITSNRRNQCCESFIDTAISEEKGSAGPRSPVPARQFSTLPPKPTHMPPPVPAPELKSESLYASLPEGPSSLPSVVPPPKPPRTIRCGLRRGSFNAYDNDEPLPNETVITLRQTVPSSEPLQNQLQLPEGVRLRHSTGWYEETDDEGNSYYAHPDSKDQWVKTESKDGKVYYYEKRSRRSVWDLPTLEPRDASSSLLKRSTSAVNELPSMPISSITPGNINTIDLSEAQARFGARKIPPSKSGDSFPSTTAQDDSSSRFYRVSKDHITGPIENKLRGTERRGQVNFTRCIGSRPNKKPLSSVLVLTGPKLYVYKESKNQKGSNISGKPEIEFHVKNLQILPVIDSGNTFMLVDTSDGDDVQYLIETPSAELRKAWETALQYSKDFDKEDRFDRRVLSTRPPPSVDQKVISMLREFFRKRPPLEKVRELGILKGDSIIEDDIHARRLPTKKTEDEPVFGSRLTELCQREGTKVPIFVTRVIRAVEARGLETSGLYRKSGNGAAIQKLRNQVNHTEYFLNSDDWDIYELSDSLKLFLRELKEPLLVYALYDDFEEFQKSMSSFSTEQNIATMQSILEKMPECHYATTKTIIEHLSKVASLSSANQMNSKNLALVFGPNMMWRDTPSDDYALFSLVGCACTEFLIANYSAIFGPSSSSGK